MVLLGILSFATKIVSSNATHKSSCKSEGFTLLLASAICEVEDQR